MQKLSLDGTEEMQKMTPEFAAGERVSDAAQFGESSQTPVDSSGTFGQNRDASGDTASVTSPPLPIKATAMRAKTLTFPIILLLLVALVAGLATGYGGFRLKSKTGGPLVAGLPGEATPIQKVASGEIKTGDVFGVQDPSTFKDSAEGYLEDGGIGGEGSHKLLRDGGVSQTVVLTSSVTDLSKFTGMQVKVWGETFKAQKAGWLMDVGRVEVINPQGQAPVIEEE